MEAEDKSVRRSGSVILYQPGQEKGKLRVLGKQLLRAGTSVAANYSACEIEELRGMLAWKRLKARCRNYFTGRGR